MGEPRGLRRTTGPLRCLAALLLSTAAAADAPPPTVELGAQGWRFASAPPATPQALEADWGQFELRLPVNGFPIPAPNCRDEIRLRWVAIPPNRKDRAKSLAQRWELLQRLQTLQAAGSTAAHEQVLLDTRHYVKRGPDGGLRLQYCNAFAADVLPATP